MKTQASKKWFRSCFKNLEQGLSLGHKPISLSDSSFWHPLMSQYVLGIRFHHSLFSIQKTQKAVLRAFFILALILKQNGHILIINTNPEFSKLSTNFSVLSQGHRDMTVGPLHQTSVQGVFPLDASLWNSHFVLPQEPQAKRKKPNLEKEAQKTRVFKFSIVKQTKHSRISYGNFKWVGGTLTNWKQISKSVVTFAKFSERCEDFCLKNNLEFPRYKKIKKCFQGFLSHHHGTMVLAFQEKPDLVFLVNPYENQNILNEAFRLNIPVIAFTQSHTPSHGISYPIPMNSYSLNFLYFCFKKITKMAQVF